MRDRNNYFPEIEALAGRALAATGYSGSGPIGERVLTELAKWCGFTIEQVGHMPRSARSITDMRDRIIFIPDRGGLKVRQLAAWCCRHSAISPSITATPAISATTSGSGSSRTTSRPCSPRGPAVEFLRDAGAAEDISVEDLKSVHLLRDGDACFTNLATRHLEIPSLPADGEVIDKAYENDGVAFPGDRWRSRGEPKVPRQWGSRQA